jgi:hypothetical protein
VVLIRDIPGHELLVYQRTIGSDGQLTGAWKSDQFTAPMPTITVVPETPVAGSETSPPDKRRVQIKVTGPGVPDELWLFPFGQPFNYKDDPQTTEWKYAEMLQPRTDADLTKVCDIPTLDGHVLARWQDRLLIYPFSQGGGPPNHEPVGNSPVTAGSADGKLMLFFYREDKDEHDETKPACAPIPSTPSDDLKMITTMMHTGVKEICQTVGGLQVASYIYGLSATHALTRDITPTAVFFYERPIDARGEDGGYEPVIYRLKQESGSQPCWVSLKDFCYNRSHSPYVAMPLEEKVTAPNLFSGKPGALEHYRLYWEPRAPLTAPTHSTDVEGS